MKNLSILVDEIEDLRSIKVPSIIVSYYSFVEEKQIYLLIGLEEIEEVNGKNVAELIVRVIGKDGYIKEEQLLGLITDCASHMGTAYTILKSKYRFLIHVTCLSHLINRLSVTLFDSKKEVNEHLESTKAWFKNGQKCKTFKDVIGKSVPKYPETRCG